MSPIMNEVEILESQAVDAAIKSQWQDAIRFNKKILDLDKNNLPAYLRLGFSYLQSHQLPEAKKHYGKALKLQPTNTVAKENIDRIKILETKSSTKSKSPEINLDPNLFLEIPGKTKSVYIVNLGQKNVLAQLSIGQEVFLSTKKRKVEVRTKGGDYIGSLPDDLSRRLILFLKAKSKYTVFIKESSLNKITVFIKESKKGRRVVPYLSFPSNIQANIDRINTHKEPDEETEEVAGNDLEKLAESLMSEEKEYLPYRPEEAEEDLEE